jgi:uncharacterized protein
MSDNSEAQTRHWLETVVIAHNFCPFAKRELRRDAIRFVEITESDVESVLTQLIEQCRHLDDNPGTETSVLMLTGGFADFEGYLDLYELSEALLAETGYEGVYQIASFHPEYCFADASSDDPANYTNRSPYPMLHLLREESLESAIANYPGSDSIPDNNIAKARALGPDYWIKLMADLQVTNRPNP